MAVKGLIVRSLGGFDVSRLITRGLFNGAAVVVSTIRRLLTMGVGR